MIITVIVPTYHRPQDLRRCLNALKHQTRPANEVLVVVRDTDTETWTFFDKFDRDHLPIHIVKVTIPGQVVALNAGLDKATGEIISITDDDAAPHPHWLATIEEHFISDHKIAGVGGRDWAYFNGKLLAGERKIVGKIQWFGRIIGNHHIGTGECREVDVLKGANMSYRHSAIGNKRFDKRLKGNGSQIHNDLGFSLSLRKEGWKLIYDPKVSVDHFLAKRFDEDSRNEFNSFAMSNVVHNETLILLEYFSGWQRLIYIIWATVIGSTQAMGIFKFICLFPKKKNLALRKTLASLQGRWLGFITWIQC